MALNQECSILLAEKKGLMCVKKQQQQQQHTIQSSYCPWGQFDPTDCLMSLNI